MRMDLQIDVMHEPVHVVDEPKKSLDGGASAVPQRHCTAQDAPLVASALQSRILGDGFPPSMRTSTTSSTAATTTATEHFHPITSTATIATASSTSGQQQVSFHQGDELHMHAESLSLASPKSSRSSTSPSLKEESDRRVHFDDDGNPQQMDERRMRRQIANCNERRRMQSINAGFQALRQFLPQKGGEKMSKAAILQQTAELIQTLKLEKERLAVQHGVLTVPAVPPTDPGAKSPPKKRRMDADEPDDKHRDDIPIYMKTIEELRNALGREHQLRVLYEQELTEIQRHTALSKPLALDASLAHLNEMLIKPEVLPSPIPQRPEAAVNPLNISTLSLKSEFPAISMASRKPSLQQPSPLAPAAHSVAQSAYENALLNAVAQQQQQQHSQQQRVLAAQQQAFGGTVGMLGLPALQAANMNLTLNLAAPSGSPRIGVATTTVPTPASVPSFGYQNAADPGARSLNLLLDAIRQMNSGNMNAASATPSTSAAPSSSSVTGTDLLVR